MGICFRSLRNSGSLSYHHGYFMDSQVKKFYPSEGFESLSKNEQLLDSSIPKSESTELCSGIPTMFESLVDKIDASGENYESMSRHELSENSNLKLEPDEESSKISTTPTMPSTSKIFRMKIFTYNELEIATKGFRRQYLLGEGGFGRVYKGWLDEHTLEPDETESGMIVAVKKLTGGGYQGHREWQTEVSLLGNVSHANLVKLYGYCLEDDQRLLVYEYMPGGSLEDRLFKMKEPMPWDQRLKVALDAAKGLAYIHQDDANVIHRDFKSSNILLDMGFNAKLSDFGLAKVGPPPDKSHVTTFRIVGTEGYADPEYMLSSHMRKENDVYSFGVVLFELLSARPALDPSQRGKKQLIVEWVTPFLDKEIFHQNVMDKRIYGHYSETEAWDVAVLASSCVCGDFNQRPKMEAVVKSLENITGSRIGTE